MSEPDSSERKSYHHGNLRAALIEAALDLITEKGPTGFTLAEAARAAGVSPAAPYRHFKGREDLIAELALAGFDMFADLLEHAFTKGPTGSALDAFYRVGRAYLAFARRYPGHYIAMFESGVSIAGNSELTHVSNRAMDVLTRAAEALMAHIPANKRPPAIMVSYHIWAMSHGIVELFARGTPGTRAPFSPDELLESGTGIYLRGLGILKE